MRFVAVLIGVFVMVVGLIGVAAPSALLRAADYATSPIGLYAAAALRVGFGIVLVMVASTTRAPKLIRALGAVAVAAGVLTVVVGVERARSILAWETAQGTTLIRLVALLPLVVGGLIVFAVSSRRVA
jgi:hypothetical protein